MHKERTRQIRKYNQILPTKRSIVKTRKNVSTINRMTFLQNFPTINALCKMAELPRFLDNKLIDEKFFEMVESVKR